LSDVRPVARSPMTPHQLRIRHSTAPYEPPAHPGNPGAQRPHPGTEQIGTHRAGSVRDSSAPLHKPSRPQVQAGGPCLEDRLPGNPKTTHTALLRRSVRDSFRYGRRQSGEGTSCKIKKSMMRTSRTQLGPSSSTTSGATKPGSPLAEAGGRDPWSGGHRWSGRSVLLSGENHEEGDEQPNQGGKGHGD
jgi:hypothetical protein